MPTPLLDPLLLLVLRQDGPSTMQAVGLPLLIAAGALILLILGCRALFRKRLIENIPTSRCKGVTIGLNELKGTARTKRPLTAFLSEKEVVYYSYKVEEEYKRTVRNKDGKTRTKREWRTVASGRKFKPFELHDDTGRIRVHPEGAEFHAVRAFSETCRRSNPLYYGKGPRRGVRRSTGRRRFTEEIIPHGEPTYVLGTARVREDIVEPEIACGESGEIFLVSAKSEDDLIRKYAWQARGAFLGALLLAGLAPVVRTINTQGLPFGEALTAALGWVILAMGVVGAVILALYLTTVYNGLVDLRNRARRAWAMLDVEFKRRHDLIPALARVVGTAAEHEKDTLDAVVKARSNPARASEGGPDGTAEVGAVIDEQSSSLERIFALTEDHPQLRTDRNFRKLMEELTRCEDKIALARAFYNDSVERMNIRVGTFPDLLLAPAAGTSRTAPLSFEAFETKPVTIELTPDGSDDQEFGEEEEIDPAELVDEGETGEGAGPDDEEADHAEAESTAGRPRS